MSSTDSIINPERLEELSGKVMSDVSGAMGGNDGIFGRPNWDI